MSSPQIKTVATEEVALRNYRNQLDRQHQIKMNDMEERYKDEVARLIESKELELSQIKNAYEVQISTEASHLDQQLQLMRHDYDMKMEEEKKKADREVVDIRSTHYQKVEKMKQQTQGYLDSIQRDAKLQEDRLRVKEHKLDLKAELSERKAK